MSESQAEMAAIIGRWLDAKLTPRGAKVNVALFDHTWIQVSTVRRMFTIMCLEQAIICSMVGKYRSFDYHDPELLHRLRDHVLECLHIA